MKIAKKITLSCLLLTALMVNACGGLTTSDKPAVTRWWLKPYTGSAQVAKPEKPVSLILNVTAVPGLDSDRILVLSGDAELKPYSAANWVEHLPELLDSLLRRTLTASGQFEVVSGRSNASSEVCDLHLEIQAFFGQLDASGKTASVQVTMRGKYLCQSGTYQALELTASKNVEDDRMKSIVTAFQQATDSVMQQLLEQLNQVSAGFDPIKQGQ